jgi:hypothetical protein
MYKGTEGAEQLLQRVEGKTCQVRCTSPDKILKNKGQIKSYLDEH